MMYSLHVQTIRNDDTVHVGLCEEGEGCFTGHILVFDLGMGTLTVSVLQAQSGLLRIVCTRTYPGVGGIQLDSSLVTMLSQEFKRCVT